LTRFRLETPFSPKGDQPTAIAQLTQGLKEGKRSQVLLGVTGSGKTFTMANVIENVQKPTLVLAHNKTLAAQLYQEFKTFFPDNAVEYFVSYYDYFQPEAYLARSDTYIEKDLAINDRIERMRLSATRSLIERDDVIIVSSVSCIYGLGSPEFYAQMKMTLEVGKEHKWEDVLFHLVDMSYKRNDFDLARSNFRVRGDVLEVVPAYEEDIGYRIEFFGDEIDRISEIDPLTGKVLARLDSVTIYPGSHYVTPKDVRERAMESIKVELDQRLKEYDKEGKIVEKQRLAQRTKYDLELMKEIGHCKGVENYSRHFSARKVGDPPPTLMEYFPKDFLLFIDESHQTIPQTHAMFNGDRARKTSLVEFGFRLPSAYDNRPLKFEEFYNLFNQVIYVSATPAPWELNETGGEVASQVIRPTGLLDPVIEVRPIETQVDDVIAEIKKMTALGFRVLVTTLTKRLSEELSKYLVEAGVRAKYLHSDIDTLERVQIIKELRLGEFEVLVGINLLREGLDIPEVALVAILDADKEGFLRSETALIQTCGRASRNASGRVILYADRMTKAIQSTIKITEDRREFQDAYNKEHNITPMTVSRDTKETLSETFMGFEPRDMPKEKVKDHLTPLEIANEIKSLEKQMKKAAKGLDFEKAASLRDDLHYYQNLQMLEDNPE